MNRTPDELINDMAFALENGGVHTALVGNNELARLILAWRERIVWLPMKTFDNRREAVFVWNNIYNRAEVGHFCEDDPLGCQQQGELPWYADYHGNGCDRVVEPIAWFPIPENHNCR